MRRLVVIVVSIGPGPQHATDGPGHDPNLVSDAGQGACIMSGAIITVRTVFLPNNRKCPNAAKAYINWPGQLGSAVCVR